MNRKFSLPYSNRINPYVYINLIEDYKKNIENIFLGLSELPNHVSLQKDYINYDSKELLRITKGLYKRIVAYNPIFINEEISNIFDYFEKNIYPIIDEYSIDGFILTNLDLAIKLHTDFPKLEIHTSCNCFQYTIRQMEMWREFAGVTLFNPPREAARMPSLLKTMHECGFKLKVLVNEACIFGCPYAYNHACGIASQKNNIYFNKNMCGGNNCNNIFKTNLILPKWLDYLDEYVDVYKLSGRGSSIGQLKRIFDAYILQKKVKYINDYACYGFGNILSKLENKGIKIEEDIIPDKLRYCECKYCDSTCFECRTALSKIKELDLNNK